MNNIIKQEITVVQNKEGAIFQIGDVVKKSVKGRTDDFLTPSKIISFNVRTNVKGDSIIKAITDFKYKSGVLNKTGILIDKIELVKPQFPRCFKIRSLGNVNLNKPFIEKINKLAQKMMFHGSAFANSFYYLNLDNLNEFGCTNHSNLIHEFQEVTIEQFLKYCENEKI